MSSHDEVLIYGHFLSDLWQLIRRNYPPELNSEEYWNRVLQDCKDLGDKYKHAQFAVKMIVAAFNELERCAKQEEHR